MTSRSGIQFLYLESCIKILEQIQGLLQKCFTLLTPDLKISPVNRIICLQFYFRKFLSEISLDINSQIELRKFQFDLKFWFILQKSY